MGESSRPSPQATNWQVQSHQPVRVMVRVISPSALQAPQHPASRDLRVSGRAGGRPALIIAFRGTGLGYQRLDHYSYPPRSQIYIFTHRLSRVPVQPLPIFPPHTSTIYISAVRALPRHLSASPPGPDARQRPGPQVPRSPTGKCKATNWQTPSHQLAGGHQLAMVSGPQPLSSPRGAGR